MNHSPDLDPATRPTRLALVGQLFVGCMLTAAFVSGVLVWRGKHLQLASGESPSWLHNAVLVHGSLNPILCVLFGWLLCHHIRLGWRMRANLVSGFAMEAAFGLLIASGAGLYYAGSEEWRSGLAWLHRICGIALPVTLAWHWIAGVIWAGRSSSRFTPPDYAK